MITSPLVGTTIDCKVAVVHCLEFILIAFFQFFFIFIFYPHGNGTSFTLKFMEHSSFIILRINAKLVHVDCSCTDLKIAL